MRFSYSKRATNLHLRAPYTVDGYRHYSQVDISPLGTMTPPVEKEMCGMILTKIIRGVKLSSVDEHYMENAFDHYKLELQPKSKYEKMVETRITRDIGFRGIAKHIRVAVRPKQTPVQRHWNPWIHNDDDEAFITVYVSEADLRDATGRLVNLFPTAGSIGSSKRPTMSRTLNSLIFYTGADNYIRRAFCARPEDIAASIPILLLGKVPRGSVPLLKRRHTVTMLAPPPPPFIDDDRPQTHRSHLQSDQSLIEKVGNEDENDSYVLMVSSDASTDEISDNTTSVESSAEGLYVITISSDSE